MTNDDLLGVTASQSDPGAMSAEDRLAARKRLEAASGGGQRFDSAATDFAHAQEKKKAATEEKSGLIMAMLRGVGHTAQAVGRGAAKAFDETSNAAISLQLGVLEKSGIAEAIGGKEYADVLKNARTSDFNPLQLKDDDGGYGLLGNSEDAGMLDGFVESATQFGVGFVGAGKITKGLGLAENLATSLLKGAATDATVFDAHQKRLSNLIQNGPSWMSNPLTEFLSSKETDSDGLGRVKNALEGVVLGTTMNYILEGAKWVKGAGKSSLPLADVPMDENGVVKPLEFERFGIAKKPDGTWTLHDTKPPAAAAGETAEAVAEVSPVFQTRQEAEGIAASMNFSEAQTARQAEGFNFNDEDVATLRTAAGAMKNESDFEALRNGLDNAGFKYDKIGTNVEAWLQVLRERILPTTGGLRDIAGISHAEQLAVADGLFTGKNANDSWEILNRVIDNVKDIPAVGMAIRLARNAHGENMAKWGQILDLNPDNPVAQEALVKAINEGGRLQAFLEELSSGSGRALQSFQARLGASEHMAQAFTTDFVPAFRVEVEGVVSTEAKAVIKDAQEEVARATKLGPGTPHPDTIDITADDFRWARLGDKVKALSKAVISRESTPTETYARSHELGKKAAAAREAGLTAADAKGTKDTGPSNPIDVLSKWMDSEQGFLDRLANVEEKALKGRVVASADVSPLQRDQAALGREMGGKVSHTDPVAEHFRVEAEKSAAAKEDAKKFDELKKLINKANGVIEEKVGSTKPAVSSPTPTLSWTKDELRAWARSFTGVAPENYDHIFDAISAVSSTMRRVAAENPGISTKSLAEKVKDGVMSYRIEAMLSGPKTQATNVFSNLSVAFYRPLEMFWTGAIYADREMLNRAADIFQQTFLSRENALESVRAAATAFRLGKGILDPAVNAFDTKLKHVGENPLESVYRLPSRMLLTADEFFKQLGYRAHVRAQSLERTRALGITEPADVLSRLSADTRISFTPDGSGVNPFAINYARENTFTNPLEGAIGQGIQSMAQKSDMVRLIFPFVRVPVNIWNFAADRNPVLAFLSKRMREDFAAGGERRAAAVGKWTMGTAIYAGAMGLVASGNVTGKGPSDPLLRKEWMAAGNQPYSVKVGDSWVSYRRGDPISTSLGLVADVMHASGELEQTGHDQLAYAVIASIMSNVTSKTYMQGVSDFFDAMSAGKGQKVKSLLQSMAGSFVPNALNQVNPDDGSRQVRGMMDEIYSRLPGLSDTVEPRRNIFGEKVMKPPMWANRALNPFTVMSHNDDQDVLKELVALGKAIPMPEEKIGKDIDLTDRVKWRRKGEKTDVRGNAQSPYDRYLELIGKPGDGMKPLRAVLTELVRSPAYQKMSAGSDEQPGGMKMAFVLSRIDQYRAAALQKLMQEYPELRKAATLQGVTSMKNMVGGSPVPLLDRERGIFTMPVPNK